MNGFAGDNMKFKVLSVSSVSLGSDEHMVNNTGNSKYWLTKCGKKSSKNSAGSLTGWDVPAQGVSGAGGGCALPRAPMGVEVGLRPLPQPHPSPHRVCSREKGHRFMILHIHPPPPPRPRAPER